MRLEKTEGVYGPTLQGEGLNIGQMVSFVRFYGCDFRCSWCDTPFSLGKDKGGEFENVTPGEIYDRLERIGVRNVVLSGGNPLVQSKAEFDKFIALLSNNHYWIQVETQGSVIPSKFVTEHVNFWSVSPKLPSAGRMEHQNWKAVDYFVQLASRGVLSPLVQFKFVVDPVNNFADYEYLKAKLSNYNPFPTAVILQPEGLQLDNEFSYQKYAERLAQLHALVAQDWIFWRHYTVRVLPQFHKIIWQKERGV